MRILLIILIIALTFEVSKAQECQIKVVVTGIQKLEGDMIIALFDNEKDYLEKTSKVLTLPVKSNSMKACFEDIPAGRYSISIIHDIDKNGKLNTRIYGPPSEPYGFHNNVKGFMGPPSFEETSFELKTGQQINSAIRLFE